MEEKRDMKVGVVISTYNNPRWLEKTLWSYENQTLPADEIIIADDGSKEETREMIDSFRDRLPIKHVWHPDRGYEKTRILNSALRFAESDYLIFTDHDLVARADFIETHVKNAEKGKFLSGGCLRLPMGVSEAISREDIISGRCFNLKWLCERGYRKGWKPSKLSGNRLLCKMMNAITPAGATWNGGNASAWREDMIAVDGFNEEMKYGGLDREFGERLMNAGIKGKQIRYSAITLHLDHGRPYRNEEALRRNREIRNRIKSEHIIQSPFGLSKHQGEDDVCR